MEERIQAAWQAYAAELARVPDHDYEALEPQAYRRLKKRLKEIGETVEYRGS